MDLFATKVLDWFDHNGRKNLPWQHDPSAYRVWISEIMLQQTQVATVIPYFEKFMDTFPDVISLARADIDAVLHLWTGLGYYARARNLHRTAKDIVDKYQGEFPSNVEALGKLPGIGRSTAGAIAAIAFDTPASILDGNVKRVLTRAFGIPGWPEQSQIKQKLWSLADKLTPTHRVADYTQAMMDLGATVCTRSNPACESCPLINECIAFESSNIASYPGRKPKKTLPVKQVVMFMLHNSENEVLLEKRPPMGIWGSLWSFPEAESEVDKPELLTGALTFESSAQWPQIRHTFSHYHLDIMPVHQRVKTRKNAVMDSQRWLWYPLNNPLQIGLAAPVKKLLDRLTNDQ